MLTDEGVVIPGEAEGILKFSPAGKHLLGAEGKLNRVGSIAAGPSYHYWFLILYHDDTVIVAGVDIAVMEQEVVGDTIKSPERLIIVLGDGFLSQVPAGHHQREVSILE